MSSGCVNKNIKGAITMEGKNYRFNRRERKRKENKVEVYVPRAFLPLASAAH